MDGDEKTLSMFWIAFKMIALTLRSLIAAKVICIMRLDVSLTMVFVLNLMLRQLYIGLNVP